MYFQGRRLRLKSTSATSRPQSLLENFEANFYSIVSRRGKKTTSAMARWHWLVRRPWLSSLSYLDFSFVYRFESFCKLSSISSTYCCLDHCLLGRVDIYTTRYSTSSNWWFDLEMSSIFLDPCTVQQRIIKKCKI